MKLDWEKFGEYGHLYSWNKCSLYVCHVREKYSSQCKVLRPRVTTKDTSEITLEQLLKMPKNLVEITEDVSVHLFQISHIRIHYNQFFSDCKASSAYSAASGNSSDLDCYNPSFSRI